MVGAEPEPQDPPTSCLSTTCPMKLKSTPCKISSQRPMTCTCPRTGRQGKREGEREREGWGDGELGWGAELKEARDGGSYGHQALDLSCIVGVVCR